MNQEILDFIEISKKVTHQLQTLISCEQEKRQALLQQDTMRIDALVQSQQALVMMLGSLEKKRFLAQQAAGFGEKNALQILEAVDTETSSALQPVLTELRNTTEHLQRLNRASMEIASAELRLMGQSSRALKENVQGTYDAGGKTGAFSNKGMGFREKI